MAEISARAADGIAERRNPRYADFLEGIVARSASLFGARIPI